MNDRPGTIPLQTQRGPTISTRANQIEWSPLAEGGRLTFENTSYKAVREALFKVFGKFPIRLSKDAIPQIIAMAAAAEGEAPYLAILEALRKYGDLELKDL